MDFIRQCIIIPNAFNTGSDKKRADVSQRLKDWLDIAPGIRLALGVITFQFYMIITKDALAVLECSEPAKKTSTDLYGRRFRRFVSARRFFVCLRRTSFCSRSSAGAES